MSGGMKTDAASCDVLVVGSGAGGMSTALAASMQGLSVIVAEKEPHFGGVSGTSGGRIWIPCNPHMIRQGIPDSLDDARALIRKEAGNNYAADRVDAFLTNGPKMIEDYERETAVKFILDPSYPDYHPGFPGYMAGGRCLYSAPFNGRELGETINLLRLPMRELTLAGLVIGSGTEVKDYLNVTRSLRSASVVARRIMRQLFDVIFYGRGMRLVNGNSLIARLAKSGVERGVRIWVSAPARELIISGGAVRGAELERDGKKIRVTANRAVILACGGMPHDTRAQIVLAQTPAQKLLLSPAPVSNTGDGIQLGLSAGAAIEDRLVSTGYRVPVSHPPMPGGTTGVFPHFHGGGRPGIIIVTAQGKRFVNESAVYCDVATAMLEQCQKGQAPVPFFFVCDHRAIRRYGLGFAKPTPVPLWPYLRSGYVLRGATVEELATKAGIDPAGLRETVTEFNGFARDGVDPRFGNGSNVMNRFRGDETHSPNPCLAPIERAPVYALKIYPGVAGSFIGLKTNRHAQVLEKSGQPIPGLYAVGNDMANVFSGTCPGAGPNLAPAMTFGYIAGRHIAGVRD